jgi:CHAT domain-containing protein
MSHRTTPLACLIAIALVVLPARAQIFMPPGMQMPGMPPGAQGRGAMPAVNCEQIESLYSSRGAAMPGGVDVRGLMAALGCKPPQAAQPQQPQQKPAAYAQQCSDFRKTFADVQGENTDWLGPQVVLLARFLTMRCGSAPAGSVEQRFIDGFMRFSDGRFAESAQIFRDAASASSGLTRLRATVEAGKSLLAAGDSAQAREIFTGALAAAPPRSPMRAELLTLLGIVALAANDNAVALERLLAADKLIRTDEDRRDDEFFNPLAYGHAPYLATALQRAGRGAEARRILDRVVRGRDEIVGMTDQAQAMMPMMQEMMQSMGMGGMFDVSQFARATPGMDSMKLMIGEVFALNLSCSALEAIQIEANQPESALEVVERCRGRALARLLANRAFHKPVNARAPTSAEIEAYAKRNRLDFSEAGEKLMKERIGTPQIDAASRPATLADMRRMAAERKATLVVYSIAYAMNRVPNRMPDRETGLTIWVVAPDGAVAARRTSFAGILPDSTLTLTQAALRAHEAIGVPGRGAATARSRDEMRAQRATTALRQFHRLLIEPVADLLPKTEGARLIVVPQGPLFLVPYAALEDAQGTPLVSRYAISVTPSLQTLSLTAARKSATRAGGTPVIVGNPLMPKMPGDPPVALPPLPGAENEANAIATLLKVPALTGASATKSAVMSRARDARYVHLATHGFLDDTGDAGIQGVNPYLREMVLLEERPDGGGRTPGVLALAPSGSDSGLLTADEIAQAATSADLVVMSACGSGQGAINDDGVIGLSRAWMAAGAPSVVVSLWAIPDEPTRDLMVAFYGALAEGSGKVEALRTAMLATRAKHPSPVNWAAFVLLGEPD